MDIIRNLYLHKYSHKMFYKTKSSTRRSNNAATTSQNNNADGLRSQQFYIYSIERPGDNIQPSHLDLPPSYDDCVKDPKYKVKRDVV